ncbi:MAG: TerB family tellurite resistance protein, partial [Aestuariivirgaceae bacterium]|nr:TerB family tellurite resistance protein [Aestuariivirgaceae bacterium]
MSIWTRIAEILGDVGDSIAAVLQRLVGAGNHAPENTLAFTIGMIALGAKMAKADGVVTGSEVKAFREIFHVPPEELTHVARVFNLSKQDVAGFESYARQIGKLFHDRPAMLEDVLDGLFHIAKADDLLHDAEMAYLA